MINFNDFDIDPVRGFIKSKKTGRILRGKHSGGYLNFRASNKTFYVHRAIWQFVNGPIPDGFHVDHINHVRTDNRIENLRAIPVHLNAKNRAVNSRNKTGITGVHLTVNGTYEAQIADQYRRIHLGKFKTLEEAVLARKNAEKNLGYHPNHGYTPQVNSFMKTVLKL